MLWLSAAQACRFYGLLPFRKIQTRRIAVPAMDKAELTTQFHPITP
jgi:hypothetical protein